MEVSSATRRRPAIGHVAGAHVTSLAREAVSTSSKTAVLSSIARNTDWGVDGLVGSPSAITTGVGRSSRLQQSLFSTLRLRRPAPTAVRTQHHQPARALPTHADAGPRHRAPPPPSRTGGLARMRALDEMAHRARWAVRRPSGHPARDGRRRRSRPQRSVSDILPDKPLVAPNAVKPPDRGTRNWGPACTASTRGWKLVSRGSLVRPSLPSAKPEASAPEAIDSAIEA